MNKPLRLKKAIAALLVAGVALPSLFQAASVRAQDAAETEKINLMVAALAAKDGDDLAGAKAKAEELLRLDPADAGAKELLFEINQAIEAKNSGTPAPAGGNVAAVETAQPEAAPSENVRTAPAENVQAEPAAPPAAAPQKELSPLARAMQKNETLYSEVESAILDAAGMAQSGNSAGAVRLLDNAEAALNKHADNVGSQELLSRLRRVRQEIVVRANAPGGDRAVDGEAARAIKQLADENAGRKADATAFLSTARRNVASGKLDEAQAALDAAGKALPRNISTVSTQNAIREVQSKIFIERFKIAVGAREIVEAERILSSYGDLNGRKSRGYLQMEAALAEKKNDPAYTPIEDVSKGYAGKEATVDQLIRNGKAQYLWGDYTGALKTFADVSQYHPDNTVAKAYSIRIRDILSKANQNQTETRGRMLNAVNDAWNLPNTTVSRGGSTTDDLPTDDPVMAKLKSTRIPTVTLREAPLSRAIDTLSELSAIYDPKAEGGGVNMIPIDPEHKNPSITISLRNTSLDKILDVICKTINFSWSVNNGMVEVRAESGNGDIETERFKISPLAVLRMGGIRNPEGGAGTSSIFGQGGGGSSVGAGERSEESSIKSYFQKNGVSFDVADSNLFYDGSGQLTVTQTRRNLEKIKRLLANYTEAKQVNIETKFLEVTQGTLRQLTTNWVLTNGKKVARTQLRTLNDAYNKEQASNPGKIVVPIYATSSTPGVGPVVTKTEEIPIPGDAPNVPIGGNLGPKSPTFEGSIGTFGSYDVQMLMTAIEENEGSDLMAAPSLTVMENYPGKVIIAQRLLYPESYGDPSLSAQSNNNSSDNSSGGGAASIGFAAGTPRDFKSEDIGVTLNVTATSITEDNLITLELKPKVVEFEGFVEYGGSSVAIAGNTTVTVPSGFYQPVFSYREVDAQVTILDGATIVFAGLTREEVKTVSDKIPVLGDLPLVGTFFRSEGRSSVKRNLMIFVTANLVGPGGGLMRQSLEGIQANPTYTNPTVLTPGGLVNRGVGDPASAITPAAPAAR